MTFTPMPSVAIVVVAAGSGTRLGAGAPKAFVELAGESLLAHSLRGVFGAHEAQVVVVAPPDFVGDATTILQSVAGDRRDLARVVSGGDTRQASVAAGLAAVWPDVEIVLVHDAARAFTPSEVFDRVVAGVEETGWGIVPVLPVVDTIKRIQGEEVVASVDRSVLASAQTPQGFRRDVLETAYRVAQEEFTDDAALVQAQGHRVGVVEGDAKAFKITTPDDLTRAKTLAPPQETRARAPYELTPRVGIGTDVHAFGGEGELWLAGLNWPGEQALAGHSDGDAVAHAIVDAVLSAAGLGDIGTYFGTADPAYEGAHAAQFLARTREILGEAGWKVGNVAVQVQAARPRLSARRNEAERVLTQALGAPVTVTGTTTDGLGFVGAREGVQAFAVAVVIPASQA